MSDSSALMSLDSVLSDVEQVNLGDARLDRRLRSLVMTLAKDPARSFPQALADDSELEAAYRLLSNPRIDYEAVLAAHTQCTARRAQALGAVVVVHDTTEMRFGMSDGYRRKHLCEFSRHQQGFLAHTSLMVSAEGQRCPLGVIGLQPFVHVQGVKSRASRAYWRQLGGWYEREGQRWGEAVELTEQRLAGLGQVIHVMDREADDYALLSSMVQAGCVFRRCRPPIPGDGGHRFRRMPAGVDGCVTVRERECCRQVSVTLAT